MLNNVVENNAITGSDTTNSAAIRYDNTVGLATSNTGNIFRTNSCIHIHFCVSRVDSSNLGTNYYENNTGDPTATFDSGGSTQDVIIQTLPNNQTFSTLPISGNGSQIYVTDATCLGTAAAGGTGAYLFNVHGVIVCNQAILGQDTHTAEITGNYGPISLLASTIPTGSYLVTIYAEVSTGVATSTITTSIGYHDDTGAQTQSGASFSGATTGTIQSLTFPVRFVTGTALTYSTSTANSPKYKIFARVEGQ
jgi:hypothetical protein